MSLRWNVLILSLCVLAGCHDDGQSPSRGRIVSPTPGSSLTASYAAFVWEGGPNVTDYWLDVGNSLGQGDLYAAGQGTNTSRTVYGLPTDGRTLYVRLWTFVKGRRQQPMDYTYKACSANCAPDPRATITNPAPGSVLNGPSVTFTWSPGIGVQEYWLDVGLTQGRGDLFGANVHQATSHTVTNLPGNGKTVYVRLHSLINGAWQTPIDYFYRSY
jgi:hypothetical protein